MRRWRERQCRLADLSSRRRAAIAARHVVPRGARASRSSGAPTRTGSGPARPGPSPFTRPAGNDARGVRRRLPRLAWRDWPGARHRGAARSRAGSDIDAVLVGDGPELASGPRGGGRHRRHHVHRRAAPRADARRVWPRPTSASRPSMSAAHAPLPLAFYWSPLKVFEYMAAGLPVVAPSDSAPGLDCRAIGREGLLYDPEVPGALADALAELTRSPGGPPAVRRGGAGARGARVQLGGALPEARRVIRRAAERRSI